MIKALLSIQFHSVFAGFTAQGVRREGKKKSPVILYVILYLYLLAVVAGMMGFLFYSLAVPYHALGLDWLYFAIAGLMGLALSLIGSVFSTQSQLYDAKDNTLLLSMPIPSKWILLSRMIPLLSLNLLFAAIVMVPAMVIYAVFVEFSLVALLLQIAALLAVTVLAQAIACLLGWLLHLLLSRLNKSVASTVFMVAFLAVYFGVYSQAEKLLQSLAMNGEIIAEALQTWVWPLYALGKGCLGQGLYALAFMAIAGGIFALVYWLLSVTFLRTATASHASRKRRKLTLGGEKVRSPLGAITVKELGKFLGTPVYLTNMGLGVILTAALPVLGLIFRKDIQEVLDIFTYAFPAMEGLIPVIICAVLSFTISTSCVSTPAVSLEGKNLWILKSMPISSRQILVGKLHFHCVLTVPVNMLAGLVLAICFGCDLAQCLLCALIPGLLALMNGVLGMWAGLKWAKLDYINDAYPCKQSVAVLVSMFGMMGVPLLLGIGYYLLYDYISPLLFLFGSAVLLAAGCFALYRVMVTWGVRKWDSLS